MTVATAIVTLTMLSMVRRGRRAISLTAKRPAPPSREESAIRRGRRCGGRAASLSARIVLVRAPRSAGAIVAEMAIAIARPAARATVVGVRAGEPALPSKLAPGWARVRANGSLSSPWSARASVNVAVVAAIIASGSPD